ncbi:MAG: hypothetical protein M3Z66_07645 [Chloroflexota bacterium]|nr:hypothetical protein [Chloroflexota bacterium]
MIVRISGEGQYDLDDSATRKLEAMDKELTEALHANQEQRFHHLLHQAIAFVRDSGKPVPHDQVVPSDVIIPPEDVTMAEAQNFFSDEGNHMHPVSA